MPTLESLSEKSLTQLELAGFTRREEPGSPGGVRLEKYGCGAVFERDAQQRYRLVRGPGYIIRGEISRLWDAGFQKFLLTEKGRHPATTEQLKALHRFDDEMKAILGAVSLYNESLGTTCDVTAYDRVQGRPQ